MPKEEFQEFICSPYCMFYKSGQKEAMTCQAAQVVDSLVHTGRIDRESVGAVQKDSGLWAMHRNALRQAVCRHCAFLAEDCDFQSDCPSDDLEPCGGFIVLAFLKEYGLIDERAMQEGQ